MDLKFGTCWNDDPCAGDNACRSDERCVPARQVCLSMLKKSCVQYKCGKLYARNVYRSYKGCLPVSKDTKIRCLLKRFYEFTTRHEICFFPSPNTIRFSQNQNRKIKINSKLKSRVPIQFQRRHRVRTHLKALCATLTTGNTQTCATCCGPAKRLHTAARAW